MQLNRLILTWQGPSIVGSAVTVLHFAGDAGAVPVAAVKTAVDKLIPALPTTVTVTTPATGETIEDTTGTLTGVWSGSGGGNTVGAGGTNAAAGVGACIGWSTGGIVNGRRLRGRTFVVPLHVGCYDTDGTLVPGTLINLNDFASGLIAAGPLAVWHRPTTKGGSDGNSYGVTSARVRDKVAVLRSRRY
jgi:hypothetical protein